jgi:RNA polymerase sigma-70 factor (ECF subfamily)
MTVGADNLTADGRRSEEDGGASEQTLIRRFCAGDAGAFDRLVENSKRDAFARAYWMTGNRDDAFDIVQDSYVKLLKALRKWDGSSSVRTWLYRVITNACIDLHRRRKTRLVVEDEDVAAGAGHLKPESGATPLHVVMNREQVVELLRHVEALPARMRQCIRLRYMDGRSVAEVAEHQGCSEGTVKATVHQGLKKLRASMRAVLNPSAGTTRVR